MAFKRSGVQFSSAPPDFKGVYELSSYVFFCAEVTITISDFIRLFFESNYYRRYIREIVQGTMINNMKENYITEFLFPLPSLREQHGITQKLKEIFTLCEKI